MKKGENVMKKIICFLFLLISLIAMICFTVSINQLLTMFGVQFSDLQQMFELFGEVSLKEMMIPLAIFLKASFEIYGFPLVVFLISLIGLFNK
jgi:hypothetical protein